MLTRYRNRQTSSIVSSETAESFAPERCRICLKQGEIPIFGEVDLSQQVKEFGRIEINYFDNMPQHLCKACYTLLQSAILFRKTAQQTDEALKNNASQDSASDILEDLDYKNDDYETDDESFIKREYLEYENSSESEFDWKYEPVFRNESLSNTMQLESDNHRIKDEKDVEMKLIKVKQEPAENNDIDSDMVMIIVSDKEKGNAKKDIFCCTKCNNKFDSHTALQRHETDSHSSPKLNDQEKCEICHKNVNKSEYKEHIKSHREKYKQKHLRRYGKVECKVCKKQINKSYYKYHMKMHGTPEEQAERIAKCTICKKTFSAHYFGDHMRRVHNYNDKGEPIPSKKKVIKLANSDKLFKCPVCDRMIADTEYKQHLTNHGGPKRRYICDQCGKEFKYPSAFKTHVLTHGSELKYQCQFCPYRGLHLALLKIHVRTHTGDYNYKCPECPSRFITKSNLNKHLQRHLGDCKFKCDTCNKGFYTKRDVDKHVKTVHLDLKNNICDICGKGYGHRDNMLSHQLKVHKRKQITDRKGRIPSYVIEDMKKTVKTTKD